MDLYFISLDSFETFFNTLCEMVETFKFCILTDDLDNFFPDLVELGPYRVNFDFDSNTGQVIFSLCENK